MYTFGSICSGGADGIGLAFEWAGFKIVWQIEKLADRRALLNKHRPWVPVLEDLREIAKDPKQLPAVDIMGGGIPCQPFSSAGKRRGKTDDRYLWPETFALVCALQPRAVFIENVAGIVGLALDTILADLESQGYSTGAFDIPACAVGAVHIRHRIFIVAYHNQPQFGDEKNALQAGRHSLDARRTASVGLADAQGIVSAQEPEIAAGKALGWAGPAASNRVSEWTASEGVQIGERTQREVLSVAQGNAERDRCEGWPAQNVAGGNAQARSASLPGAGLSLADEQGLSQRQGFAGTTRSAVTSDGARRASTESGMVRDIHGLPSRMDGLAHRWPAPFGAPQADHEPSRTISGYRGRARRIRVLGDSAVPQQVYPFAATLYAVLAEQDRGPGAA